MFVRPALFRKTFSNPAFLTGNAIASPNNMSVDTSNALVTVTADVTLAPDGSMGADRIVPNSTSGVHRVSKTGLTTTGGNWTARCRLKAAGYNYAVMIVASNDSYTKFVDFYFDLKNAIPLQYRAGASYLGVPRATRLSNDWVLCEIYVPGVDSNSTHRVDIFSFSTLSTANFSGDTVAGMFAWGIELAPAPN